MLEQIRRRNTIQCTPRGSRVLVATTLAAALFACSGAARADAKTDAQTKFNAGRDAAKRGDCATAIDHFAQARALYPTAGSLYNIADCEERIGRLVSARAHWAELLRELPPGDERVADAKGHVEALDRRIPTVKIALPAGAPPGTSIALDGAVVAPSKLGAEQPIDPGSHAVVVKAPGRVDRSKNVTVAEGARGFVVEGELGAETATPAAASPTVAPAVPPAKEAAPLPTEPPPASAGGASRSTLAYVAGAVGVAGLATTVVSTIVLLGKKSTIGDHCDANKACDDIGLEATGGVSTWSAIGTVGFGAGVLGIAGFFLLPRASTRESAGNRHEPSLAPRALAIGPTLGSQFVGANVTGTW